MSIFVQPRPAKAVAEKASPTGPGSGVLITEFPLDRSYGGQRSPQRRMKQAWSLGISVPWITLAEDAIGERFSGVDWHLEDENDEEVTDETQNPDARAALMLLEKPSASMTVGAPFYRSDLWALTSRVMGLCGSAFILLDQPELLANTPAAMVPIAPWRFTPQEDEKGNLLGWWIDKTQTDPGIPVRMDEVLHYPLRRNFEGHFGIGNVETAMLKLSNSTAIDQHLALVLSGGGRLSGILSPKTGIIEPDTMVQMERDWRTIVEQSDAAKRLQLVRAPVDFQKTTLTPQEMQVRDMMNGARDDLLTIWGVPLSIVGGSSPSGLNSGDTRKYDEAAIWQGPVHARLTIFREVTQYQLLDRWQARGATVELELDEPEFDDDSPRYDLLGKSLNTPMTTEERRALIGLPPVGDDAIDKAILLPATLIQYAIAPNDAGEASAAPGYAPGYAAQDNPTTGGSITPQVQAAGETSDPAATKKATIHPRVVPLRTSLIRLREQLQERYTPKLRTSVSTFLDEQKRDIARRIRERADHLASHPTDSAVWWNAEKWDQKLRAALVGPLTGVSESVSSHIAGTLAPKKADPVDRVLTRGAARVKKINQTTRDLIDSIIATTIEQGGSILEAADALEASAGFDEYRAELIARTELMDAYNASALGSYSDAGLSQVQAIDGDGDPECAERDGQIFDIDEADSIEDHPNGTLDWVPVIGEYFPQEAVAKGDIPPMVTTLEGLQAVIRNLGAPPVVNMPEVRFPDLPAPIVNVTPEVHVAAPIVDTTPFARALDELRTELRRPVTRTVHRDEDGRITSVTEH